MAQLAEVTDGRRLRRQQNREAVIDAVLELFSEGVYQPGAAVIAARAGLSIRSLFRYFDDLEDLHNAAADRYLRLALPLLEVGAQAGDPARVRIAALVRARARLFERVGPGALALRASAHRHAGLRAQLDRNRAFLRAQISSVLAPELAATELLPVLDVLCSFESYDLLRRDQGLSRNAAEAALDSAICALLGVDAGVPAG
jgi:TetR/AcrR family transcriptional regulator, regulator of autoinduction and epiphytic fitness